MSAYGVTPAGFVLPSLVQILADLKASVLATIDPNLDVSDDQPLGQLLGIMAAREMTLWELLQVGYNATNRGDAEGAQLDNVGDLTGTKRLGQTTSKVACTSMFSQAGTYAKATLFAYVAGASNQKWSNQQDIIVPGTVGGNPIGPSNLYSLTNAVWQSTTDGPIYGDALVAANSLGSGHGALSVLDPVAGWHSLADTGEVILGTLVEDDPPYRIRQRQDLSAPGSATLDALGAAILVALQGFSITPAPSVQMYENTGLTTDGNGLPGKSFMAVVFISGGASDIELAAIAGAIWNNKPAGVLDYGTTTVAYTDALGIERSVSFSLPTAASVTIALDYYVAPGTSTSARAAITAAISLAITAASQGQPFTMYGGTVVPTLGATTTLVPGEDVVLNAFKAIAQGQSGVIDVQNFAMTSSLTAEPSGNLHVPVNFVAFILSVTPTANDFVPTA